MNCRCEEYFIYRVTFNYKFCRYSSLEISARDMDDAIWKYVNTTLSENRKNVSEVIEFRARKCDSVRSELTCLRKIIVIDGEVMAMYDGDKLIRKKEQQMNNLKFENMTEEQLKETARQCNEMLAAIEHEKKYKLPSLKEMAPHHSKDSMAINFHKVLRWIKDNYYRDYDFREGEYIYYFTCIQGQRIVVMNQSGSPLLGIPSFPKDVKHWLPELQRLMDSGVVQL